MRRASIAEARAEFSTLVNAVAHGKERIIVTSHGRPKAALVPLEDLDAIEDLPQTDAGARSAPDNSLDDVRQLHARILKRRGGKYLPSSLDDLYAIREERSTHV